MAFDNTIGSPDTTSYVSLEEADVYLQDRLYGDTWEEFEYQENALILASSMIDWNCKFLGTKASIEQAMQWPRDSVITKSGETVENNIIPNPVKIATYELALSLMESDLSQDWDLKGYKKVEADTLKITVDGSPNNPTPSSMPERIFNILSDLTRSTNEKGAVRVVRLVRA